MLVDRSIDRSTWLYTEFCSSLALLRLRWLRLWQTVMEKGKMELTLVMVAMVVMSSIIGGAVAAAPPFPLDCSSYVLDGAPVPLKFCCMEVQDQFLLKKSVGIGGYCKAVTAVRLYNGPLSGTELDLALSIPNKCQLSSYHAKDVRCAGKVIPGGV